MTNLSIGERLRKAKRLEVQREIALDWCANWQRQHNTLLARLERDLASGDIGAAQASLRQLAAIDGKSLGALPRVLDALSRDDI